MKTTETDRVGILPVTSFRGVQPTGIAICERGRMCVWFPRRHDGVSCSVTEIFGDGFSERALCAGYEKYEVIDGVRVRHGNETKDWWGPINAGVTLVWKLF